MPNLVILPNTVNNEHLYLFDGIVYFDYDLYSVDGKNKLNLEDDIDDLSVPDNIKADIKSALDGKLPTIEDVSDLDDKKHRFASSDISIFMAEYMHLHSDNDKNKEGIKALRELTLGLGLHNVAWQYCFKFGYDDDMRQVVINSNNASSAYSWCYHIKHELAMREIILKSNDINTISYYSLFLKCEDPKVENLILNDEVHQSHIDFYLDLKERQKRQHN